MDQVGSALMGTRRKARRRPESLRQSVRRALELGADGTEGAENVLIILVDELEGELGTRAAAIGAIARALVNVGAGGAADRAVRRVISIVMQGR